MLHETASAPGESPYIPPETNSDMQHEIDDRPRLALECVAQVMAIQGQIFPQWEDLLLEDRALMNQHDLEYVASFKGLLHTSDESAYSSLETLLIAHGMMPLFREGFEQGKKMHIVHVLEGQIKAQKSLSVMPNLMLFFLTIFSLLLVGTQNAIGEISLTNEALAESLRADLFANLWRGLPYALSLLLILGTHEMAHWLVMRRHKIKATLPYFIPSFDLSIFGTLGAFIAIRDTIRNRKTLFDIGASGPLAGLIVAMPILLIGLATSPVVAITGGAVEGNSILYALSKILIFGRFLPDGTQDVLLNQLAWAGWTGLFVTALNLIPLGQWDGGHILYSTLGSRARRIFRPILFALLILVLFAMWEWGLLLLLMFFMGRIYAVPLNDITPLDPARRRLAQVTLCIFLLIFIPMPIIPSNGTSGLLAVFLSVIWIHRARIFSRQQI